MNWINGIAVVIAALTTFLPVPLWVRILTIGIAGALLLTSLLQDIYTHKRIKLWVQHHRLWLIILPVLTLTNVSMRLYEMVWDFSYGKIYALREESVEWISKIKAPVTILIFLRSDDKTHQYTSWLQKSANKLGGHLKLEIHNINRDIDLTKRYGVKSIGEAVLVAGDRWVKIPDFKEGTVVAGLMRLLTREGAAVCFLSGHGEEDILSDSVSGLSQMADTLRSTGYKVETVSLVTTNAPLLLQRCAMLAVIGTASNLFPTEVDTLHAVTGKIPMLFGLSSEAPESLAVFFHAQGLDLGRNNLINPDNIARGVPATDIVAEVQTTHAVVDGLQGLIYLPHVQALLTNNQVGPHWDTILVLPASEPVITSAHPPEKGPFVVAAASGANSTAPLVVVGSADAFSNTNWKFGKNADFATRTVRWMLKEDTLQIPSSALIDEPIMDLTEQEKNWITNGVFYIFPGSVLLICLLIWWRHRWV